MNDEMKLKSGAVYGKTIKSYALDKDTIEAIDRVSSDLGIKSRSETLREIVKRYAQCHDNQNTQN